ncbi:MAG TPA: EAL domain-containing protein [Steroidobacteraceae bacterium]|nr:EAL domain-containing protein [Steroidobacteraceae bacterium]
MSEQNAVPLIVLSASRDPAELINGILRRAGHPVHCTWISTLSDLGDALVQINPELLLVVDHGEDEVATAAEIRDQFTPAVPLIVIADATDETRMAQAMQQGARDVVTLANEARLQAVMGRELRSHRLERALDSTLKSARDARRQLESVLQHSNDAIAQVQEGIVVDANAAWLELFGFERNAIVGQPIMDVFDESTHAALKGALAACLQGRWSDHTLSANGYFADGSRKTTELLLTLGEHDGEPCVRLTVPARQRDERRLAQELEDAVNRDASTGMLHRRPLLEAVNKRLQTPAPGGVRYFAAIRPDKFATIEHDVGVLASEDVLIEFARLLHGQLNSNDLAGRLGGVGFLVLLERGNTHDVEVWSEELVARAAKHVIPVGDKSLSLTCTVGLSVVPAGAANGDAAIVDAIDACRRAQQRTGNQVATSDRVDADTRVQSYDKVWVKHIKAALMENRFRLVQQPIASLQGNDPGMFDVLVRMLDPQGKEVLPGEFLPAAERNDLLKNIDRWVVGASLSFAAQRKTHCLFVRLSKDTLRDGSFLGWIDNQMRSTRAEAARLCFQVPEDVAASHVTEFGTLAAALHKRGFRCALERFGSGRDPQALLNSVPLNFVKIDGALVQSLTRDAELQERVRQLVQNATRRKIETIAERVEDANTMAVLWQLGVQYIQGYFVHAPEEVVLRAER